VNLIDDGFIDTLQELRTRCGFPLVVNSGYRCPAHNDRVSTTGLAGPHTTGQASDVGVARLLAFLVLEHAVAMNLERLKRGLPRAFEGFGFQQKGGGRFIHLDAVRIGRPTVWSY
jgi:hypothetical protein